MNDLRILEPRRLPVVPILGFGKLDGGSPVSGERITEAAARSFDTLSRRIQGFGFRGVLTGRCWGNYTPVVRVLIAKQ